MADYTAYICAIFIGAIMGLTGGGGSILTVPVLVYILGLNPVVAAAYSLFIVGTTSGIGSIKNYPKGIVDVRKAILFAIPSLIAVFLTRKFIVPAIPLKLFEISGFIVTRDFALMILFAIVMTLAAISMLRPQTVESEAAPSNKILVVLKITSIGVLIGLIGAGGGFLIIPALYVLWRLPIRTAIGTSLLIISINSLVGFTGDIGNMVIDWGFLLRFSGISIIGIFIGIYVNRFFNDAALRKIFGIFVLLMAGVIFTMELIHAFSTIL